MALDDAGRAGQGAGHQDHGTGFFERCDNVECNDRLILDNED